MDDKRKQEQKYFTLKELYFKNKYTQFIKASKKYLDMYGSDVNLMFMRAKALKAVENFKEAIDELEKILLLEENGYSLVELYYIYYYLNEYEKALELLPKIYRLNGIKFEEFNISKIIMEKSLGILKNANDIKCNNYLKSQILNYNPDLAFERIKIYFEDRKLKPRFKPEVDITYLYDIVMKNLDKNKRVNAYSIFDLYYFPISGIGEFDGKICNYVRVEVEPNTKNILNIAPTNKSLAKDELQLELDYDRLFQRVSEKKSSHQIEKFYRKYNKKV